MIKHVYLVLGENEKMVQYNRQFLKKIHNVQKFLWGCSDFDIRSVQVPQIVPQIVPLYIHKMHSFRLATLVLYLQP